MADRLRTDSEFDQFLLDHFAPDVRRAIPSSASDRLDRENALLHKVGAEAILRALDGPRYALYWLGRVGAAVGLAAVGALAASRLSTPNPDAKDTASGSKPALTAPLSHPPAPVTPSAAPAAAAAPPPLSDSPDLGAGTGRAPVAAVGNPPTQPLPHRTTASSKPSCPHGLSMTLERDGQHLRSPPLPATHGFSRGGKVRLVAASGPERGRTLGLATITETESTGLVVFADTPAASLPGVACAIPLREEIQIGRELGKILVEHRLNIGAGDRVHVGDLYEVLGPAIVDETAPGRTLGRQAIGTIRITKTDAAFADFTLQDGQAPKDSFVRPKRPH